MPGSPIDKPQEHLSAGDKPQCAVSMEVNHNFSKCCLFGRVRTTVKLLVIIAHIQLSLDICHLVIIAIDVSNHHNYLPINQINMKCMCNKDSVKFVERNIFQLETSRAS